MQTMVDVKKPDPDVLADRKARKRANDEEGKKLGRHRRRIKERLKADRDWPIAVGLDGHLDRADIDKDDVMAPLPEDLKVPVGSLVDEKMEALRAEADRHESFAGETVPVDPGVLSRRRRDRDEELAARDRVTGSRWTAELVEERLTDAYKVLFRASVSGVRPREFGNAMPQVVRQMSDLVHQAGNKSLRNAISHRFKTTPSTAEMRRAEEALGWSLDYLRDVHPDLAGFANLGAMWHAWGAKISHKCRDLGVHRQVFYRDRKTAIELIVEGLLRDGKAPT